MRRFAKPDMIDDSEHKFGHVEVKTFVIIQSFQLLLVIQSELKPSVSDPGINRNEGAAECMTISVGIRV